VIFDKKSLGWGFIILSDSLLVILKEGDPSESFTGTKTTFLDQIDLSLLG
jgi:hypothetical protein